MRQALLLLVIVASPAFGAAGDLVQTASFTGQRWYDVTHASDGSVWALGEYDGKIYHLDMSLQLIAGGTINHPFGPASPTIPFKPVCRGIAFDSTQSALFVLNASTLEVARVDPANGAQIGNLVTLQAPATAGLVNLAFDVSGNVLWSVDAENDRVLGFDPATGALLKDFPFPGDVPAETYLYGTGVAYVVRSGSQYLYVLSGDIFAGRSNTVKILSAVDGSVAPFEIPLLAAGDGTILSCTVANDSVLVLLSRSGEMALSKLSGLWPAFLPVTDLACAPQENGAVVLTWSNHGTGQGGAYTSIQILRDGGSIALLAGNAVTFTDSDAPAGDISYTVRPSQGLVRGLDRTCSFRNRRGAVLDWIPFPGGMVSGIAVDPDTGDVWATDSKALTGGLYRIWHFTPALDLVGYIDVGTGKPPYGITFWPDSPLLDPAATVIMVGNETDNTVQKMTRDGTFLGGAVPTRLPASSQPGAPSPKTGALAFVPNNGEFFLAVLDDALHQIVWVDRYGFPPDAGDTAHRGVCVPSGLYQVTPARGLDLCPQTNLLHFGIAGAAIREIDTLCNVTTFDLVAGIPAGYKSADRIKDFAYRLNVLYVSSPANNAIFRMLAYPIGRPFVRGNVNGDANPEPDVADVIFLLMYLFEKGAEVTCLDAADANDDGRVDISDAVYLLFFQFGSGPFPPPPYPGAGTDPTLADELSC